MEEIEIISELSELLTDSGFIETVHLTAEFETFSNKRRTDFIFYPKEPNIGIFIEYKRSTSICREKTDCQKNVGHKIFIQCKSNRKLVNIYSTDHLIRTHLIICLNEDNISLSGLQSKPKSIASGIYKPLKSID